MRFYRSGVDNWRLGLRVLLGLKIFAHALRMLFGNTGQVLRIAVVPASIAVATIFVVFSFLGVTFETIWFDGAATDTGYRRRLFAAQAVVWLVSGTVWLWIAVAWHRFVLLDQPVETQLPQFPLGPVILYFGYLFAITSILVVVLVPSLYLVVLLSADVTTLIALTWIISVSSLVILMRVSVVLPGVAIGADTGFGDAWQSTKGANGTFLIIVLLQFIPQVMISVFSLVPVIGDLLKFFIGFLVLPMIGLSILTTLYGHFIEKRELT